MIRVSSILRLFFRLVIVTLILVLETVKMEKQLPPPYNVAVERDHPELATNCGTPKQKLKACIEKTETILKATSQGLTIAFDTALLVKLLLFFCVLKLQGVPKLLLHTNLNNQTIFKCNKVFQAIFYIILYRVIDSRW